MDIIDISWPITETITAYKDKKTVEFKKIKSFEKDKVRESVITLSSHTGTHIDAPAHFLKDGIPIEQVNLNQVIGACKVIDLTQITDAISEKDLQQHDIEKGSIVLLKTKNSFKKPTDAFDYNFIYLNASGAEFLASKKIKAVGIDYLGIERNQPDHATHTTLMKNNIVIIEGLRLEKAAVGDYFLCCLPLYSTGLEAAPARAVLLEGL